MKRLSALVFAALTATAAAIPMSAAQPETVGASYIDAVITSAATSDVEYIMFAMLAAASLAVAYFVIRKAKR